MHPGFFPLLAGALLLAACPACAQDPACNPDQPVSECISSLRTNLPPTQDRPARHLQASLFPNQDMRARIWEGEEEQTAREVLLLANQRALLKPAPDQAPASVACAINTVLEQAWSDMLEPMFFLDASLPASGQLPSPGQTLRLPYRNTWAYGEDSYEVAVQALTATEFRYEVTKTATRLHAAAVDSTANDKAGPAQCPAPPLSAEAAFAAHESGQQVLPCQIQWIAVDTSDDRRAEMSQRPPNGRRFDGTFSLQNIANLGDEIALAEWRSQEGLSFKTLGEARSAAPDQHALTQLLRQCPQ